MSIWQLLGLVFVAGGVGGLVNSLINEKGFTLPHTVSKGDGTNILIPGFIGNLFVGSVAGTVSWLLYGPFSQLTLGIAPPSGVSIDLAVLGGAVLVGMSGSGWLTSAVATNVLRFAAAQAAQGSSSPEVAKQMLQSAPIDVLRLAQQIGTGIPTPPVSTAPVNSK